MPPRQCAAFQTFRIRGSVGHQHRGRPRVRAGLSAANVVEVQPPFEEQHRLRFRPNVIEEHPGFRPCENQSHRVAVVGAPCQPLRCFQSVGRVAPHPTFPRLHQPVVHHGVMPRRRVPGPNLRGARIQIESPQRGQHMPWRQPFVFQCRCALVSAHAHRRCPLTRQSRGSFAKSGSAPSLFTLGVSVRASKVVRLCIAA